MLTEVDIKYYKENHKLFNYHVDALQFFLSNIDFEGKRVLEIGGSNMPRELVLKTLGAEKWVSVDVVGKVHYAFEQQNLHYGREIIYPLSQADENFQADNYLIFDGFAENILDVFYNNFDIVISITAFEHILQPSAVLDKIYRSLKLGGSFYSYHGPLWSCRYGHHIWVTPELNFNNLGPLPPFAHLLMRPAEVYSLLIRNVSIAEANLAVHQMFFSDRVNRLFYDDYVMYMKCSDFKSFVCEPYGTESIDDVTLKKLQYYYPHIQNFDAYGMLIKAYK